ncbi:PREDICTED: uncharacterized protein LOC109238716 [Nicotiana attenuata]|uniref:uncharacterized protein LOC109238716 n=1 Tax=Nicotiana attenuata TaxID=49451 RepID=UPI0009058ADF|nr:PREDICTED: uncharacterized protein LOC109238716 [Nicotiana attenuata]
MGGKTFAEVIKAGEMIENGIKTGRITSLAALHATSKAIQTGALGSGKKKEKEVAAVMALGGTSFHQRQPSQYQSNAPHSQHFQYSSHSPYQTSSSYQPQPPQNSYHVFNTQPTYQAPPSQQPHHPNNTPGLRPNRPARNFTPLGEPLSVVFERLQASGLLYPVEGRIPNPLPRSFDPTKTCAYHSGVKGHSTDRCYALKHKVEDLIEAKQIKIRQPAPNVNNNPLPNHNEASVNMIGVDEEDDDPARFIVHVRSMEDHTFVAVTSPTVMIRGFTPIEILGVASTPVEVLQAPIQLPVVDTRAVPWNYQQVVMECHGKETTTISGMTRSGRCYTPEKLSGLRQGNECNVPPKNVVTDAEAQEFLRKIKASEYSVVDQLKKTNAQIPILSLLLTSDVHRDALLKILSEAYVPTETTSEAISGMVGCILDCHLISFDDEELPPEGYSHNKALHITVKYRDMFISRVLIDGGSEKTMDSSGWVVPSTLHQTVKFKWDQQQIVIHGEGDTSIYREQSISFIDVTGELGGATYHAWEIVDPTYVAEERRTEEPKMSCAAIMVAKEMLKNGYQPGLGLGKTLNGRVEPIVLPGQQFTFGLGYEPTQEELKEARQKKGKEIHLPKPIPTIDQTFLKPTIVQTPDVPVEVSCDDIIEGVKNLFVGDEDDHDMVFADIAETLIVRVVEPGSVLKNWTCISAPVRREFQ